MRRSPHLSEDTEDVLREILGYTDTDIADLTAQGILT